MSTQEYVFQVPVAQSPISLQGDLARAREQAVLELKKIQQEDFRLVMERLRRNLEIAQAEERTFVLTSVSQALKAQQEKDLHACLAQILGQVEQELLEKERKGPPDATTT